MLKDMIGLIPAGGTGSRMKGFPIIKEMLPVPNLYAENKDEKTIILVDNALNELYNAEISKVVVVINERKTNLLEHVNNNYGYKNIFDIAYVYQQTNIEEYGLPYAIMRASEFLANHTVIMRFPDTIISSNKYLNELIAFHNSKNSELTLGVFPTENPERLGPVLYDESGKVLKIEDKPKTPSANNTWNCLIWEPSFTGKIVESVVAYRKSEYSNKELIISDIMNLFLEEKHRVYAKEFSDGSCFDIANVDDFMKFWQV